MHIAVRLRRDYNLWAGNPRRYESSLVLHPEVRGEAEDATFFAEEESTLVEVACVFNADGVARAGVPVERATSRDPRRLCIFAISSLGSE